MASENQKYKSSERAELERLAKGIAVLAEVPAFLPSVRLAKAVGEMLLGVPDMYYGWADQVHRAAVSIPANVCEAQGRNSLAQRLQYTAVARGSVYEVFGLLLCPPPDTDVSKLLEDTREVIRLLDALVLEYARQRAEGG